MLFFTADTHFGHGNIMKYCQRPGLTTDELAILKDEEYYQSLVEKDKYSLTTEEKRILAGPQPRLKVSDASIQRMDDYLIEGINSQVSANDTIRHLGDFCFGQKHEYFNKARQYLNRIKCKNVHIIWGNHDHYSIAPLFASSYDLHTIYEGKQRIVLCHYAMAVWEKSHRGAWQLYGHSHSGAEGWMDTHLPNRRSMDVGVDNVVKLFGQYRPVSYDEVQLIMSKKNGSSIDHHKE